MKSGVKRHFTRCEAKVKKCLATQDDRSNTAGRDRRDQGVVRLSAWMEHKGGGLN